MSNYINTYNRVLLSESGYAAPFRDSGETYKGIDRKYFPAWQGWAIVDAYKSQYGIPKQYTIINNPTLESYVAAFYKDYLGKIVNIESIENQNLADFTADFLIHKQYDAVKVINAVAAKFNPAPPTAQNIITPGIVTVMNSHPQFFYSLLKEYRAYYYYNPATFGSSLRFSASLITAFLTRVNKFPATA